MARQTLADILHLVESGFLHGFAHQDRLTHHGYIHPDRAQRVSAATLAGALGAALRTDLGCLELFSMESTPIFAALRRCS